MFTRRSENKEILRYTIILHLHVDRLPRLTFSTYVVRGHRPDRINRDLLIAEDPEPAPKACISISRFVAVISWPAAPFCRPSAGRPSSLLAFASASSSFCFLSSFNIRAVRLCFSFFTFAFMSLTCSSTLRISVVDLMSRLRYTWSYAPDFTTVRVIR